jgi:molybdopterin synthase sulfur carrier subunit
MATVFIPPQMRDLTGGTAQAAVEAQTVRQAIEALEAQFPGIKARLCKDDELAPGLQVSIDQVMTARGIRAPLKPDSELHFLPAFGGG